jgi:hypothetical protein
VDLRWLADRGAHVLGVELSPIAVEKFFAEQGLVPRSPLAGCTPHAAGHAGISPGTDAGAAIFGGRAGGAQACSAAPASSGWALGTRWPTIHVSVRRGSPVCWNAPTSSRAKAKGTHLFEPSGPPAKGVNRILEQCGLEPV